MPSLANASRAAIAIDTSEPVASSVTWRSPVRLGQHIGARAPSGFRLRASVRSSGRPWRVSARIDGRVRDACSAKRPAFGGLDRIGRAEHQEVRDRAQRREMLDRLVGRPVLAEADRIVRHHIDDAQLHQRRQPDRRPGVIGEGQEGPAIGNEPAMRGDAVHRRRHADARARRNGGSGRRNRRGAHPSAFRPGVVRRGQVGRAAEQLGHRRDQRVEHRARGLARRQLRVLGAEIVAQLGDQRRRNRPAVRPSGGAGTRRACRARRRRAAASQACRTAAPRAPASRHSARTSSGTTNGPNSQPSRSLAPLISSAPSGAPCAAAVPALVGAPNAIIVRQAMRLGRSLSLGAADRGGDRVVVHAVDPLRRPAMRPEPLELVVGDREAGRPVDRDRIVVPQHDQLVELEMPGERRSPRG